MRRIILTDHKTGHFLGGSIAGIARNVFHLPIENPAFYRLAAVTNETDRWVVFVRHPYEIITSGYNYHMVCTEEGWATSIGVSLYAIKDGAARFPDSVFSHNGVPYQTILRKLSPSEGLKYEMGTIGKLAVDAMYQWPYYERENVCVVKLEDFAEFDKTVTRIFEFLLSSNERLLIERIVAAVRRYDVSKYSPAQISSDKHITNKRQLPFVYKEVWKPEHYELARKVFPKDILSKFGYDE